jgi:hypothetical protein
MSHAGPPDIESQQDITPEKNVELTFEYVDPADGTKHETDSTVMLDPHGFPLSPQPSQFKDDPLVCFLNYHQADFRIGQKG